MTPFGRGCSHDDTNPLKPLIIGVRRRALAVVSAAVIVAVSAVLPRAFAAPNTDDGDYGSCVVTATHIVRPVAPQLGAEVAVTTGLRAHCPESGGRLHIVLLVDASEHMVDRSRDWLEIMLSDLEAAVRQLSPDRFSHARIGVVSFSEGIAQSEARLTDDVGELVIGLHNIAIRPGDKPLGGLGEGMRKTRRMFQNGRDGAGETPVREVVVLASRGFESNECEAVRASTNEVKSAGIVLVTACGGGSCERRCLAEAASAPDLAFASSSGWGYLGIGLSQLIGSTGPFHPLAQVHIVDELSDQLMYVGGGDPNAGRGNRLEWTFRPWPAEGVTRSYRARVLGAGRFRLSENAWATLTYDAHVRPTVVSQTVLLPRPWLNVPIPTSTPTQPATAEFSPTPDGTPEGTPDGTPNRTPSITPDETPSETPNGTPDGTPTGSRTPGVEHTATPEPTASWPGARGYMAFLPVTLAFGCSGGPWPADIVVAVDVSGSMQGQDVGAMRSRWHAAREVALDLVQYHLMPDDRVAVVPFAGQAEVTSRLSDDRAHALASLEDLPRWNGSRMDRGLDAARRELASSETGSERKLAIVLLTDGDLNQTEVQAMMDSAIAARSEGIDIYVVVLGELPVPPALAAVAGSPGRVFRSSEIRVLALADAIAPHLHCGR